MELPKQIFENLARFIYNECGIVINDKKAYLIQQRLEPVAISAGCGNFAEFYNKLSLNATCHLKDQVIAAITTNETSFFRDKHPFEAFKDYILPRLERLIIDRKNRSVIRKGAKVRIWSAASSTGQEPYCISILAHEYVYANRHKGISNDDFQITATDISSRVLARAISGEFSEFETVRGLPQCHMEKYFTKVDDKLLINESVRNMVEFRRQNLMEPFIMLGGFDVIFCRNVLIYFDDSAKRRIYDQFHHMLSDDGFLILGSTETIYGITDRFESVRYNESVLYKKK